MVRSRQVIRLTSAASAHFPAGNSRRSPASLCQIKPNFSTSKMHKKQSRKGHLRPPATTRDTGRKWERVPAVFQTGFFKSGVQKPLKIENVRQSLCRATLNVIDYLSGGCAESSEGKQAPHTYLLSPPELRSHEAIWNKVAAAFSQHQLAITSFVPPRNTKQRDGGAKDGKTWNRGKWEEFRTTNGIDTILFQVTKFLFSEDVAANAQRWGFSCCLDCHSSSPASDACRQKWKGLREYFAKGLAMHDPDEYLTESNP